jgi:hypothetical protein
MLERRPPFYTEGIERALVVGPPTVVGQARGGDGRQALTLDAIATSWGTISKAEVEGEMRAVVLASATECGVAPTDIRCADDDDGIHACP